MTRGAAVPVYFSRPVPYEPTTRFQESLVAARIADRIGDIVLFLEHRSVVTLGAQADGTHVLLSAGGLRARHIHLARSSRGGDVTFHGPGQIVLYPILKLRSEEADVRRYLWNLEEVAIRTARDFGVQAHRRDGMTGAWTRAGKLAAIGIRVRRWVTFHGMSFNVGADISGFGTIVPCGLQGEAVTSLQRILGSRCPPIEAAREQISRHFAEVFQRALASPLRRSGIPRDSESFVRALARVDLRKSACS